jgi:hypothetical protein
MCKTPDSDTLKGKGGNENGKRLACNRRCRRQCRRCGRGAGVAALNNFLAREKGAWKRTRTSRRCLTFLLRSPSVKILASASNSPASSTPRPHVWRRPSLAEKRGGRQIKTPRAGSGAGVAVGAGIARPLEDYRLFKCDCDCAMQRKRPAGKRSRSADSMGVRSTQRVRRGSSHQKVCPSWFASY